MTLHNVKAQVPAHSPQASMIRENIKLLLANESVQRMLGSARGG